MLEHTSKHLNIYFQPNDQIFSLMGFEIFGLLELAKHTSPLKVIKDLVINKVKIPSIFSM